MQTKPDENTMEEVEQVICNLMKTKFARFKQSCQGGMVNRNAVYETNKGAVFVKLSDQPQVNNLSHKFSSCLCMWQ